MKRKIVTTVAATVLLSLARPAAAGSTYDGSWNLNLVTQRGSCDLHYDFTVDISNGLVTHPNLPKFKGLRFPGSK